MKAYINKNNIVVYIAPTKSDEITPNSKGKLLFTEGEYDANTMKYTHVLGKGEEVRAVNGEGLAIGDKYVEPVTEVIEPTIAEKIEQLDTEAQALERELALEYAAEKALNDPEFLEWLDKKAQEATNE